MILFRHFGDDPLTNYHAQMYGELIFPIKRDIISDWNGMIAMWDEIFTNKMQIEELYTHPLIMTECPGNGTKRREETLMHAFEELNVPKFYLFNTALANFYYSGKNRSDFGLILDCGHGTTNISCIYMGMFVAAHACSLHLAGKDINEYLAQLMSHESTYFHLDTSYKITSKLKEKYCFVSRNIINDEKNGKLNQKNFVLPDGRKISIKNERFLAPELLFAPNNPMHSNMNNNNNNNNNGKFGNSSKNEVSRRQIDEAIIQCVNQLDDDEVEKDMYSNIICCGGTAKV